MPSGLRLPTPSRLHRSGWRLCAKPSASGSWPRLPGAVSGGHTPPVQDAVVTKPADHVTLSAAEGEAMIARLSVYAPSRSACEILVQVVRWSCWLVWTVQGAQLRLKKRRTLLCGPGPKPPMRCEAAAASVAAASRGASEGSGDGSARAAAAVGRSTEVESTPASVAAAVEPRKPRGGHQPGTGRRGAEA